MSDEPTIFAEGEPPYPLALIVCDATWEDPATGKRTMLGCFSNLQAGAFPAVYPILGVYAAITDGRGRVPIMLRLIDAEEEREPIFATESEVDFGDPREVVEIVYHFTGVVFPLPGEYRVQLFAGDEPLLERRIVLYQSSGTHL